MQRMGNNENIDVNKIIGKILILKTIFMSYEIHFGGLETIMYKEGWDNVSQDMDIPTTRE